MNWCNCRNRPPADPHCSPCLPCDAARARASVGARMVGGFVVTPDQVAARLQAIDAMWSTLAIDVTRCPAFVQTDPATGIGHDLPKALAFNADLAAWKVFLLGGVNLLNAGTMNDQADGWQSAAADWQAQVRAAGCQSSAPPIPKPAPPGTALDSVTKAVPWVAGAVIAIALLGALRH